MTTDDTNNSDNILDRKNIRPVEQNSLLFKVESYVIRGAIFEVYNQVGCGFLEGVYQECLMREFRIRDIPFTCQPELQIAYKGEVLSLKYRPDFVCFEKIIIELKAIRDLGDDHRAQILNYLKASGLRLGFLVNFGSTPKAIIERFIL